MRIHTVVHTVLRRIRAFNFRQQPRKKNGIKARTMHDEHQHRQPIRAMKVPLEERRAFTFHLQSKAQQRIRSLRGGLKFIIITVSLAISAVLPRVRSFSPPIIPKRFFRSVRRAHQTGPLLSDGCLSTESFNELYNEFLPLWLLNRCSEVGYSHPSRIQREALNQILIKGKDAIVQAETGSGKTLAYLLPALAKIDPTRSAVQAMIVVPTRELGLQVARVAKRLAAGYVRSENDYGDISGDRIMVMSVLQGSQNRRQRAWAWAEPPHLVIGTPTELCDMVRLGGIKRYNSVTYLVVDEVDACLLNNAGSLTSSLASSTLQELLSKYLSPTYDDRTSAAPDDGHVRNAIKSEKFASSRPLSFRQTIFASATLPQHRHFVKQCRQNQWTLRDPVHVCLRPGEQLLPPTLRHAYAVCRDTDSKLATLNRILGKIRQSQSGSDSKKVLIFADGHRPLEDMARSLAKGLRGVYYGDNESLVRGDREAVLSVLRYEDSLSQRAEAVDAFRGDGYSTDGQAESIPNSTVEACLHVMISTDLAARGLDVENVSHVIHFDLPPDADTYVHRAGRTGRFGRQGQVVSIVIPKQEFVLTRLVHKLGLSDVKCIARQKVVQ